MGEEPGRLSLNLLLQRLNFIEDYWYEVGETLNVSDEILYELQKSPQANASPEKNLKVVIIKWIEANQCQVILPLIVESLRKAPFIQENGMFLEKLNNLQVPHRMDARQNNNEPRQEGNIGNLQDDSDEEEDESNSEEENESSSEDDNTEKRRTSYCHTSCCRTLGNCLFSCKTLALILNCLVVIVAFNLAGNVGKYPEKMDDLDKIMMEDPKYFDKLLEIGVREIRILVTGKTGMGKSTLINGLIGDNVTKEGGNLAATTKEVEKFSRSARGVPMAVFDSPGLQDGTENEKEYLLDMEKKCKQVDLVLYTIKMTDHRIHTDDIEAMKKLTNAFGEQFWKRAMFVLTYANEVRDPKEPEDDDKNQLYFEGRLRTWREKLPQTVKKELKVSKKVAQQIPIIPAGHYTKAHLPGRRYWFSQFWTAILDRMKNCSKEGYSFMLQFNKDRFKRAYEVTEEDLEKTLYKQPIVKLNSTPSPKPREETKEAIGAFVFFSIIIILLLLFCFFH